MTSPLTVVNHHSLAAECWQQLMASIFRGLQWLSLVDFDVSPKFYFSVSYLLTQSEMNSGRTCGSGLGGGGELELETRNDLFPDVKVQ